MVAKSVFTGTGEIVARSIAGLLGGYLLANFAALAIIRLAPGDGRSSQGLAQMIAFALFGAGAVLAFSLGSARKACRLLGLSTAVAGAAAFLPGWLA